VWEDEENSMMTFGDVMKEFDHVDDPDVLERVKTNHALHSALSLTRPRNWWGTGLKPEVLFKIAKGDGIPVVDVPPSEVLLDLAAAPDRNARMSTLLAKKHEIIDHCKEITDSCYHPWVADSRLLTEKAIAAYEDGHYEAAMALAVSVSEPLAIWASTPRWQFLKSVDAEKKLEEYNKEHKKHRYKWAALELSGAKDDFVYSQEWSYKALIAPIPLFFKEWYPDTGDEPPKSLSRHIVAHQPTQQHFSPENALLSLMLATSLLYAQEEWSEMDNYL
jgi:hypothetical protein